MEMTVFEEMMRLANPPGDTAVKPRSGRRALLLAFFLIFSVWVAFQSLQ